MQTSDHECRRSHLRAKDHSNYFIFDSADLLKPNNKTIARQINTPRRTRLRVCHLKARRVRSASTVALYALCVMDISSGTKNINVVTSTHAYPRIATST